MKNLKNSVIVSKKDGKKTAYTMGSSDFAMSMKNDTNKIDKLVDMFYELTANMDATSTQSRAIKTVAKGAKLCTRADLVRLCACLNSDVSDGLYWYVSEPTDWEYIQFCRCRVDTVEQFTLGLGTETAEQSTETAEQSTATAETATTEQATATADTATAEPAELFAHAISVARANGMTADAIRSLFDSLLNA